MTPDERRNHAQTLFDRHPELFPGAHRPMILNGIITLGMSPFEANLAGGAFSFKVQADKTRWPEDSDPLDVMWAQSRQVDDSDIWMTFRNATQFPASPETSFKVYFERGRAVQIQAIEG